MSATSSWRYAVDGDVLTAANRVMSYTIRLGVLYSPRSAPGRKPIGPRRVTQFLDDGARLYTTGNSANSSHTLASVASFVSTYQVPRTLMMPTAPTAPAVHADERLDRIEALVAEMHAIVRQIADGLGVSK